MYAGIMVVCHVPVQSITGNITTVHVPFHPSHPAGLLLTPCHRYITGHGCSCVLGSHTLLPDRVIHINGLTNEQPAEWEEALSTELTGPIDLVEGACLVVPPQNVLQLSLEVVILLRILHLCASGPLLAGRPGPRLGWHLQK